MHAYYRLGTSRTFFEVKSASERVSKEVTDLRPEPGSAAPNGSIWDWTNCKSDLYCGAISTPAGAIYLGSGRVRSVRPNSLQALHSPLRLVLSSLVVRGFIG